MAPANDMATAIQAHLASKHIPPIAQWLQSFVSTLRPNAPLIANQKTAEFRLLSTDITQSLQVSPRSCFPAGIASPEVQEQRVPGPVPVQILDIQDIGKSSWSQVEAIEMEERGEMRKGQEVIRVVPDDEDNSDPNPPTAPSGGPYKLLLQDAKGNKAYAFEMEKVKGVGIDMSIGSKLVLRDFVVARGMILMTARGTEVLGGKVETWDKKWREDRKGVLKERAGWREGMGMGMNVNPPANAGAG